MYFSSTNGKQVTYISTDEAVDFPTEFDFALEFLGYSWVWGLEMFKEIVVGKAL